jgi:hypothetical protein
VLGGVRVANDGRLIVCVDRVHLDLVWAYAVKYRPKILRCERSVNRSVVPNELLSRHLAILSNAANTIVFIRSTSPHAGIQLLVTVRKGWFAQGQPQIRLPFRRYRGMKERGSAPGIEMVCVQHDHRKS